MESNIQKRLYDYITKKGISHLKKYGLNINYYGSRGSTNYSSLSLFADINKETKKKTYKKIIKFIPKKVLKILKGQKIHPASYLHINLFMFVYKSKKKFDKEYISNIIDVSKKILSQNKLINFRVKGLGISDSTIFLKVYSDELLDFRKKIKIELTKSKLAFSEKYSQIGAHISLIRFTEQIEREKVNKIIKFVKDNKETDLGKFSIHSALLVEKKYQNKIKTKKIHKKIRF